MAISIYSFVHTIRSASVSINLCNYAKHKYKYFCTIDIN